MLQALIGNPSEFWIIVIRCLAVYIFMLLALRIFGKKEIAQLSISDFIFIILIGNSVQNAMVGSDNSLVGGMVAALMLFIFNALLKIGLRNRKVNAFLQGKPVLLIFEGKLIQENLNKSGINEEEIEAVIREHGLASVEDVGLGVMEVDGNISIVGNEQVIRKTRLKKIKGFNRGNA
ncbi:MAG: DUF421 domain-containing protein [Chitinophagaceae bacterium]|nr:DUF421 domain-containing protein [Chitinophagaceae bacterium]